MLGKGPIQLQSRRRLKGLWDLTDAAFSGSSIDTSDEGQTAHSLAFSADGTKMYVNTTETSGTIFQYTLATAWEVSTSSYASKSYNHALTGGWVGMFMRPDGTEMFTLQYTNAVVRRYALSTAWDISSSSYDNKTVTLDSGTTNASGLFISPNGTKMYTVDTGDDLVKQYTMSTAWDPSTATYDTKSKDVSTEDAAPRGVYFSTNGLTMFITGFTEDVHMYTLTTAWDVSTASYDSQYDVTSATSTTTDLVFNPNGTKMYILNMGDSATDPTYVRQHSLKGEGGGWDLTNATYDSKSISVTATGNAFSDVCFNSTGTQMLVANDGNDKVYSYTLSTAWDVSTATIDTEELSVAAKETQMKGMFMKSDGTELYVCGGGGRDVTQYTLSTAWDLDTGTYTGESGAIEATQDPYSVSFNGDGTKMYMLAYANETVYQYTLSTAWLASTASYATKSVSVVDAGANTTSMFFNADGTKMYITSQTSTETHQYTLSTAWDVSTATHDGILYDPTEGTMAAVTFKPDGTKMYMGAGTEVIYQYSL